MSAMLRLFTAMLLALSAAGGENRFSGCGRVSKRFKRIVGGRESRFGHHPWQAALYESDSEEKPYCGGVLISDRSIITAAHCILQSRGIETLTVRLGEYNVLKSGEEFPPEVYKVEQAEMHPYYWRKSKHHDLAILKLDRTVRFNQHIVPVCLPPEGLDPVGQKATVTGWGLRDFYDATSGPAILNEVKVQVIPNEVCEQWMSKEKYRIKLDDGQMCAGLKNGGRDACAGDSGGPLTIFDNGRRILIGVVSTGILCGEKNFPGLYINVEKYLTWIKATINRQRMRVYPRKRLYFARRKTIRYMP